MKTKLTFRNLPTDYHSLLSLHMLRPLHDAVDYQNALEILEALAGYNLTKDQEDYFEALSLLVEAYETAHLPSLADQRGLPLLKHLVEENNLSAAALSRLLGTDRSLGVRLLNGERNLTVEHIKKLSHHFRLPATVFIG